MRTSNSPTFQEPTDFGWARLEHEIRREEARDSQTLNLCAYDNILSKTASRYLSSPLGFRYRLDSFDGTEGRTYARKGDLFYKGYPAIDSLESLAREAALRMFAAADVDMRPLSGVHASLCTLLAASRPGDTIYSFDPGDGGHFATRPIAENSGRKSRYLAWNRETMNLDLEQSARLFREAPPSLIFLDHGCPLFPLPVQRLRELVGPRTTIVYDASHTLGLIAGGHFQKPLQEGADILQGNTHKSFPGPQKAMILFRDRKLSQSVKQRIDAGLISSQHTQNLMALCVSLLEMEVHGADYVDQMLLNAKLLERFMQSKGHSILRVSGEAQTHILMIDLGPKEKLNTIGDRAFRRLIDAGFAINVRPIFGRTIMRLGTQEITRKGFGSLEMLQTSRYLHQGLTGSSQEVLQVRKQVAHFVRGYQDVHYSFDRQIAQVSS